MTSVNKQQSLQSRLQNLKKKSVRQSDTAAATGWLCVSSWWRHRGGRQDGGCVGGSGRGGGAAGGGCIESDCHFIFNNTQLLCSLSDQQLRLIGTQWRAKTHTHHVHVHTDNTCTCTIPVFSLILLIVFVCGFFFFFGPVPSSLVPRSPLTIQTHTLFNLVSAGHAPRIEPHT